MWTQIWISVLALAVACAIAIPVGVYFGHRGTGELLAVAIGNAGPGDPGARPDRVHGRVRRRRGAQRDHRAGRLGIPPILTNTFVGVRQVDPGRGRGGARDRDDASSR